MHVDASVITGQRPAQGIERQVLLADQLTGLARQGFEQAELGAGQFQRGCAPACLAPPRPHFQCTAAYLFRYLGRAGFTHQVWLHAAQYRPQARHQLARRAGLGYIVVGTQLKAGDAVDVVATGRQQQYRHLAARAHAA
ncbi:hypothetical protein D9M71_506300 [compost metagenome]